MSRVLLVAVAALAPLASPTASAATVATSGMVLWLATPGNGRLGPEAETRVAAELASVGYRLAPEPQPSNDSEEGITALARQRGALAVVRLDAGDGEGAADDGPGVRTVVWLEAWVPVPGAPADVHRHIRVGAARSELPAMIAIRAHELLRACLVEAALRGSASGSRAQPPPAGTPASTLNPASSSGPQPGSMPPSESASLPRSERTAEAGVFDLSARTREPLRATQLTGIGIGAGGAVLVGTGGAPAAAGGTLRASVGTREWSVAVVGGYAAPTADVTASLPPDQGSTQVRYQLAEITGTRTFWPVGRIAPFIFLGGGAMRLTFHGEGSSSEVSRDGALWTALAIGGAGVAIRGGERWGLLADASSMLAESTLSATIIGVDRPVLGRLTVGLTISAYFRLAAGPSE
jgi:hypothetical protein